MPRSESGVGVVVFGSGLSQWSPSGEAKSSLVRASTASPGTGRATSWKRGVLLAPSGSAKTGEMATDGGAAGKVTCTVVSVR